MAVSCLSNALAAPLSASRSSCLPAVHSRSRAGTTPGVPARRGLQRRRLGRISLSGRHGARDHGAVGRLPVGFRLVLARGQRRWPTPALIMAMLLAPTLMLLAATAAPEQPHSQEAICQRHHGVEACAVW